MTTAPSTLDQRIQTSYHSKVATPSDSSFHGGFNGAVESTVVPLDDDRHDDTLRSYCIRRYSHVPIDSFDSNNRHSRIHSNQTTMLPNNTITFSTWVETKATHDFHTDSPSSPPAPHHSPPRTPSPDSTSSPSHPYHSSSSSYYS